MKEFKDTIQKYLQERAAEDLLFAPRLANPKKSIDECCRYILGEARKRGTSVVMSDTEVFGMAVHYYDEENIEVGKAVSYTHLDVYKRQALMDGLLFSTQ